MANAEENKVTVEKIINVPVAEVFTAIAEGKLFFNCSGDCTSFKNDFRVGGFYRVTFAGHGITNVGRYEEIIPQKKIAFTWGDEGADKAFPKTLVTIDLFAEANGQTRLLLNHTGFTTQSDVDDHRGGWLGGIGDLLTELEERSLCFIRYFDVPVAKLYEVCSHPDFFFGPVAEIQKGHADFKVGGSFQYPTAKDEIRGKFLEIVPNQKIVFTWEKSCETKTPIDSKVSLIFTASDDGSALELLHEKLPNVSSVDSHRLGWMILTNALLKAPSLQHSEKQ
jgi:uncharacterized protein YndB with AHSA1/START domain